MGSNAMAHLKRLFRLVLVLTLTAACLGNETLEDAMVRHLSESNYLQGKAEIVFLLDRSGSVGAAEFETEKGFVESFLTHIVVDANATRVAVISYSDTAVRHIDYLKEPKSKCFLAQELHDVVYEDSGATNIEAALQEARLVLKNARPNVNKVIVLISDGLATKGGDPAETAARLKEEGVQIFCFGVGRFLQNALERLASNLQNVFTCSGFREFKRLARKIRGDPHESSWSSQTSRPSCDHLCDSVYKGQPNDPGCCDHDARCSCALLSGLHTCVCKPGYYDLSGLAGDCKACPRGTYKTKLEPASSCIPCPKGSTTAEVGSTKLSDCYCEEGYTGNPSLGTPCRLIDCPALQKPTRGYMLGACDTSYGSVCHFMCEEGYELVDSSSDVRTCQSNGKWSGKTAVCQEIRCPSLLKPSHGDMNCESYPLTVGKRCRFGCHQGYVMVGSEERECTSSKKWTGTVIQCIPITCEMPPRLVFGSYYGCDEKPRYHETCIYSCNRGFELKGPRYLTCKENGTLVNALGTLKRPTCTDITNPEIICPPPIRVAAEKGKNTARVKWTIPFPTDNSGYTPKLITSPASILPNKQEFPIGQNTFHYIAIDHAGLRSSCPVYIQVIDEEPPVVIKCPNKIEIATNDVETVVHWDEPQFEDNSKRPLRIYQSAHSGRVFRQGSETVTYIADDESGNRAECSFDVIISRNKCQYYPPPDNGALACDDFMYGELCQVFCNEKFDFARKPAEWYECGLDSEWKTFPPHESIPWPDCSKATLPGAVRQKVGFYYRGNCSDPRVQAYIKKLFLSHLSQSLEYADLCRRRDVCTVDAVDILCGKTAGALSGRRKRNAMWQPAGNEQLELEFEITIDTDQEFNDTEAVLKDFLKTIQDLKWDFDDESAFGTTLSPFENLQRDENNLGPLVVTDEETKLFCKPGSVEIDNMCVLCSAGTFYDTALEECVDCPVGYFQEYQGQLQCEKCPNGTSTELSRARNETSCKGICAAGTYSATGLETCIACPIGKYQDSFGMSTCYDCPNGTTTGNVGGMSIEDCKDACPPGSSSQNGLGPCELCPLHYYQPKSGQMECLECPGPLSTTEKGATEEKLCLDIDPCLMRNTCLNNGSCTRDGRSMKCDCRSGFDGDHCENDVDECRFNPCSNGGSCVNTEGSFFCDCLDGFSGLLCEEEIDECASSPCQNDGKCIDKINGYTCACSKAYEGTNCETKRELCFRDVVCLNSGVCMFDDSDNSSFCACEQGFAGIDCSLNINDCENITCRNNGSCVDGINSFTCACPSGYNGKYCEVDIDECQDNLCHSGSTCKDLIATYVCLCPPGWNGTSCDNKMDSDFILTFPETAATIANMASLTFNSTLTDATISLWVQTNDTERSGTPLSYAVASTSTTNSDGTVVDNALTISDCSDVKIYVNNEPVVTDLQLADGQWHHLAFTWSSENSGKWSLYKDGELKQQGNNLQPHKKINGGGTIVIGQEQDSVGGGFSPLETFTGNISRVNIWNSYFSNSNITRLCNMDDDIPDKVLAWPDFLKGLQGDVNVLKNSKPIIKIV